MAPHPHPGSPALSPSPTAECLEAHVLLLRFKLGLLYLHPERLLEQVARWVLPLSVHVEAASPWWSGPMPVGMASGGGKPLDGGCFPRESASLKSMGFRWDPSLWTRSWTEGEEGESTTPQGHLTWGAWGPVET